MMEKPPSTARLLVTNFIRNTTGMIGLLIVFLVVTSSIFAVQLSGYEPTLMDLLRAFHRQHHTSWVRTN
jgi:hypothetical protein